MSERSAAGAIRIGGLVLVALALGAVGYRLLMAATLSQATPAYSSVRTDPSGTSVLFGAYARAGLAVSRGYEADSLAGMVPGATVAFVLAPEGWANHLGRQLDDFARRGGWVVLAGPPLAMPTPAPGSTAAMLAPPEEGLDARLGAGLETAQAGKHPPPTLTYAEPVAGTAPAGAVRLPLQFPLNSLKLSPAWKPLYQGGGRTYMAVRAVGRGRVVLASEATFVSNDNLAHAPDAELLSWLVAGRRAVWADETLHGLQQARGMAWLLQRYRLNLAAGCVLATLALMAWGAAANLERPPKAVPGASVEVAQTDAGEGYARLLQRAIPLGQLLPACWRQFAQRHPQAQALPPLPAEGVAEPAEIMAWYRRLQQKAAGPEARKANEEARP
ncbi:MAG TPA: DUF4350 domain-containing protein [Terriglobales bacterium]|nr:DUF4350 domain-containing protein [Terriglobales bacterium]